jgi:hypothetical protein
MVAHRVRDEGVAGSNPATPTKEILAISGINTRPAEARRHYRDSYWDRNLIVTASPPDALERTGGIKRRSDAILDAPRAPATISTRTRQSACPSSW